MYQNTIIYPPPPGTASGPCLDGCSHLKCGIMRRAAAHACRICGDEIGYGHPVYLEWNEPVHAACFDEHIHDKIEDLETRTNRSKRDQDLLDTLKLWLAGGCTNETLNFYYSENLGLSGKLQPTGARV